MAVGLAAVIAGMVIGVTFLINYTTVQRPTTGQLYLPRPYVPPDERLY